MGEFIILSRPKVKLENITEERLTNGNCDNSKYSQGKGSNVIRGNAYVLLGLNDVLHYIR